MAYSHELGVYNFYMDDVQLEKVLKSIANRRRIKILKILKRRPLSVGEIAKEIKLSFKSTSRHLSILHSSGLIEKEQSALLVFNKPVSRRMKELLQNLSSF